VAYRSVEAPGSWPATELRVYTWKERWSSVAERARKELPSYRLSEHVPVPEDGCARWSAELIDGGPCGKRSELEVFIMKGRAHPLRQTEPMTDKDPAWVTVLVASWLDENWVTMLRHTFFSMPE
jgi:hypothetical protein